MSKALVLIPGMMCDARVFSHQFSVLSREIPVMVAPLSEGGTPEEMAVALLPSLPERFSLLGLSMGGNVAMEVLRLASRRVERACLIGCSPLPETPQMAAAREPLIISARLGRLREAMEGTLTADHLAAGPRRAEVLHQVHEMAETLGPDVFVRQSRALQRRRDQQVTLRRLKMPVLVMGGVEDTLVPIKRLQFMAELIPNASLEMIEGAGHLPVLEQPEATTAVLRRWLELPELAAA